MYKNVKFGYIEKNYQERFHFLTQALGNQKTNKKIKKGYILKFYRKSSDQFFISISKFRDRFLIFYMLTYLLILTKNY